MKRRLFGILRPNAEEQARDLLARAVLLVAEDLGFETKMTRWVNHRETPRRYSYEGGPNDPRDDDVWISFDWITTPPKPIPGTVIYYNLEPMPLPRWVGNWPIGRPERFYRKYLKPFIKRHGGSIDVIFDYCEQTTRYLQEMGERAFFCPPGYHESMEVPKKTKPLKRGVYYLGRRCDDRRSKIAGECGASVHLCRSHSGRRLRNQICVTPGVHLNIHRNECQWTFSSLLVNCLYLSNRRFVLSEPVWWSPLISFEHWVEVPAHDLRKWTEYFMTHPRERDAIGRSGYRWIKRALHLKDWLPRAMKLAGVI